METRFLQYSDGRNANSLDTGSLLRISPILSDPSCTKQNTTRPSTHSHVDNTFLVNVIVVSTSVGNTNKETNSNTSFNHTFSRSKREHHPLVLNKTLMLVAWQVSWRCYLSRYFLRKQPSLFLSQEVKGLVNIVHWPRRSGLASVTHGKFIDYDAPWIMFLCSCLRKACQPTSFSVLSYVWYI